MSKNSHFYYTILIELNIFIILTSVKNTSATTAAVQPAHIFTHVENSSAHPSS